MEKIFDVKLSIDNQSELCKLLGYQNFTPNDGVCYRCGFNIFEEIQNGNFKTGIDVHRASSEHVTGCPHCCRSYCD
ncbi:hypothetical protein EOM39_03365 [Candidatus Gracilibacteria bacterium]|nr:hypothetical protein [Candidatus Gracilibacteria bacterium]